jgi:son of sevenless-like protein
MNAGYSSGWCQVAFGIELVAKEISCRAKGDEKCIFVMGHPSRINEYVVDMKDRYGIR